MKIKTYLDFLNENITRDTDIDDVIKIINSEYQIKLFDAKESADTDYDIDAIYEYNGNKQVKKIKIMRVNNSTDISMYMIKRPDIGYDNGHQKETYKIKIKNFDIDKYLDGKNKDSFFFNWNNMFGKKLPYNFIYLYSDNKIVSINTSSIIQMYYNNSDEVDFSIRLANRTWLNKMIKVYNI